MWVLGKGLHGWGPRTRPSEGLHRAGGLHGVDTPVPGGERPGCWRVTSLEVTAEEGWKAGPRRVEGRGSGNKGNRKQGLIKSAGVMGAKDGRGGFPKVGGEGTQTWPRGHRSHDLPIGMCVRVKRLSLEKTAGHVVSVGIRTEATSRTLRAKVTARSGCLGCPRDSCRSGIRLKNAPALPRVPHLGNDQDGDRIRQGG